MLLKLHSGLYRNMKGGRGYISGVDFQQCSNVSILFTLNIYKKCSPPTPRGTGPRPPKYTPHAAPAEIGCDDGLPICLHIAEVEREQFITSLRHHHSNLGRRLNVMYPH